MAKGNVIQLEDLPPQISQGEKDSTLSIDFPITMAEAEKEIILEAISFCGGNKTKASDMLGIGRKTLHRKLNEYFGEEKNE